MRSGGKELAVPHALIDIVMPVYGEWGMLAKAISKVEAACAGIESGYRIIVVDNGTPPWQPKDAPEGTIISPAEQAAPVRELLRPNIDRFIRIEENEGYPGACNKGVAAGRSPLICILTADVYMEPGSITRMVRELDDPGVGLVGPLLLFPKDESPHGPAGGVQSAGIAFNISGDPFHVFIGWTPENPRVRKRREMQAITGAVFVTRRSLWEKIGGFGLQYGKGTFEDMEMCFAVRSLESKVVFQPEAVGYHYTGGSIRHGAGRGGFPLGVNSMIFKGRWGQYLQWDEFRFYDPRPFVK
jgi:GT2 family glycosyltransferase